MRKVVVIAAVLAVVVVQTVGIIAVHRHVAASPDHAHTYVVHDHGHTGHADDLVEGAGAHQEPTASGHQTPASALMVLAAALLVVAAVLAGPPSSWPHQRRRVRVLAGRRRLGLLAILVI